MDGGVQRRKAFFTRRVGRSCEIAFGGMAMQQPPPFGVGKGACAPNIARKRFGDILFYLFSVPKMFCVLFKEKGTSYHDKGGVVWRFVAKKDDVSRW